jgi:hypothetical protein
MSSNAARFAFKAELAAYDMMRVTVKAQQLTGHADAPISTAAAASRFKPCQVCTSCACTKELVKG